MSTPRHIEARRQRRAQRPQHPARLLIAEHDRRRVRRVRVYQHGPIGRAALRIGVVLSRAEFWLLLGLAAYLLSK